MSLIQAFKPIITSRTASIHFEISGTSDGRMSVIVKPVVGPVAQTAPQELHALCAALATPIKVVGDPQEIEKALTEAVTEQSSHRQSWAERANELEARIAEAAQKDASAKKTATTAKSEKSDAAPAKKKASAAPTKEAPATPEAADDQPELEL